MQRLQKQIKNNLRVRSAVQMEDIKCEIQNNRLFICSGNISCPKSMQICSSAHPADVPRPRSYYPYFSVNEIWLVCRVK